MHRIVRLLGRLWADRSGISSVEYAMLLGFIVGGIIFSAEFLSNSVSGEMNEVATSLNPEGSGCGNSGSGNGTGGDGGTGQGGDNTC